MFNDFCLENHIKYVLKYPMEMLHINGNWKYIKMALY